MSGRVDINHEDANMYGCLPCPACGTYLRVPHDPGAVKSNLAAERGIDAHLGVIECLQCGHLEPITEVA